jgi:magnesium chelatase subunit D
MRSEAAEPPVAHAFAPDGAALDDANPDIAPKVGDLAGLAAAVLAVAPQAAGGLWLRAGAGPARDRWLAELHRLMPPDAPWRRMPVGVSEARLLGGLDLPATLASGRLIGEAGLIALADGGILVVSMAERLDPSIAALIARAMDTGEVHSERDGLALHHHAEFGLIALDEGEPGEFPPVALTDRLGLFLDLAVLPPSSRPYDQAQVDQARARLPEIHTEARYLAEVCAVALQLGISSLRTPLQALAIARILAALEARDAVAAADVLNAIALAMLPRATKLPTQEETEAESPPEAGDEPPPDEREASPDEQDIPEDITVEAALSTLPPGLLASLLARVGAVRASKSGVAGQVSKNAQARGRAFGTKAGDPRTGARLSVIDTLRAAAPWQKLRHATEHAHRGLAIRREDFRIIRRKARSRTTTIFVVDASGSSALQRLQEAKGAVQLLLGECYVRRDEVALIAFRGRTADIVLPPTRALTRASRALAAMVGGGGTPLATAIETARLTVESVLRAGQTPFVVLMTDGRANIARDGSPGRVQAMEDALAAGRRFAELRQPVVVIDTSARPAEQAAALARAMQARYLPLPQADPQRLVGAVSALQDHERRAS